MDASSSRRSFVRAGAGLLAAPAVASAAQMSSSATPVPSATPTTQPATTQSVSVVETGPIDPREKYPKPPFPDQDQPWPALASKMDPRPDHGEKSYVGSGRLKGRKALITGGDSGMGRAAAIAFAREGADVAFGYLPQEEPDAQEVVELIRAEGRKAVPLPGDIRDEAFCRKFVTDAVQQLGGLDILVNNAARQHSTERLEDITTELFDAVMKTNVYALFWITQEALKHMPAGSTIISTASIQAYDPSESLVDYAQTKAAIVSFTKSMAKQLAQRGIRVNAVAPGPVWTPLQLGGGQGPGALPKFGANTPFKRPAQPAELASAYVLLADSHSTYTSGEVLLITGGHGGGAN
ncbi:MAG: SDR family oxidoreductase [Tepidisphaeraceae bacterium]